jgi:hypothetical protein
MRFLAVLALLAAGSAAADSTTHLRRVAIVVGANDPPPGHQALRFAHDDANHIAEVLRRVGRFGDVRVMLDPRAADLLAQVSDVASAGGDLMLVFYYSGHSDGQSIFPHGEKLSVAEVRDRLAKGGARIGIGILDTCRGGAWTQTNGLAVGPPLDPIDLLNVATEGTALIASSSGLENAHETEGLHGSYFTHHFAAGLLGAADRSGDGEVTLQEAFDYAKERTIRDTALMAPMPQHPSFDIKLHGRQDIVLASLDASASALEIAPPRALLQVIHLDSGVTLAEAPPQAVAVGHYLVRRVDGDRVWAREVLVATGPTVAISEADLELSGSAAIAMKGIEPIDRASLLPKGWWLFQLAVDAWTGPSSVWDPTLIWPRAAGARASRRLHRRHQLRDNRSAHLVGPGTRVRVSVRQHRRPRARRAWWTDRVRLFDHRGLDRRARRRTRFARVDLLDAELACDGRRRLDLGRAHLERSDERIRQPRPYRTRRRRGDVAGGVERLGPHRRWRGRAAPTGHAWRVAADKLVRARLDPVAGLSTVAARPAAPHPRVFDRRLRVVELRAARRRHSRSLPRWLHLGSMMEVNVLGAATAVPSCGLIE